MPQRHKDYLKEQFETGDRPIEDNFKDLIDSTHTDTLSSLCLSVDGGTINAGISAHGNLYTNEIHTEGMEGKTTLVTSYSGTDSGSTHTLQFINGLFIKSELP
jgi:hypothetical protein